MKIDIFRTAVYIGKTEKEVFNSFKKSDIPFTLNYNMVKDTSELIYNNHIIHFNNGICDIVFTKK